MKTINKLRSLLLCLPVILLFLDFNCSQEEAEEDDIDNVPDQLLEHDYRGNLNVRYTNVYPEWDESTSMEVHIDKEVGIITFENAELNYSGEIIINGDSKITRSGSWTIDPTGRLEKDGDIIYIPVDAGVIVVNDVQKVYARDNDDNWVLVNETEFDSEPNSDLIFELAEAEDQGSVISSESEGGSLIWSLYLVVDID